MNYCCELLKNEDEAINGFFTRGEDKQWYATHPREHMLISHCPFCGFRLDYIDEFAKLYGGADVVIETEKAKRDTKGWAAMYAGDPLQPPLELQVADMDKISASMHKQMTKDNEQKQQKC